MKKKQRKNVRLLNNFNIYYNKMTETDPLQTIDTSTEELLSKNGVMIIVAMLITGIGAFGMFPETPKSIIKVVDKYPSIKWILVYLLIYQGAGSYNELNAFVGTALIYFLMKYLYSIDEVDENYFVDLIDRFTGQPN